jgi:hypothetical protein
MECIVEKEEVQVDTVSDLVPVPAAWGKSVHRRLAKQRQPMDSVLPPAVWFCR